MPQKAIETRVKQRLTDSPFAYVVLSWIFIISGGYTGIVIFSLAGYFLWFLATAILIVRWRKTSRFEAWVSSFLLILLFMLIAPNW